MRTSYPCRLRTIAHKDIAGQPLCVLFITILVIPNIFGLVHAMCGAKVAAVGIRTLAEVAFESALMTEVYEESVLIVDVTSDGNKSRTYSSQYYRNTCSYKLSYASCSVEHSILPATSSAHAGIGRTCHSHSDRQGANGCTSSGQCASYVHQATQLQQRHVAAMARPVFVRLCCNKHISSSCLSLRWVQWRYCQ